MKNIYYLNKSFLLFLIAITSCLSAKAQFGSNITYKAIDSVKYEVALTIYRDCSGSPVGSTNVIEVLGKSTGAFKATLNRVSITDITGIGDRCPQKSKCSGGTFVYGIEEIVYKGIVDISGGACEYFFTYSKCCRPAGISTGLSNTNHFNEATVNKCYGLNTSTQVARPRIIIGVGNDFKARIFHGDTVNTNDSVVYSLARVLTGKGVSGGYAGSYDYKRPIIFLGFPNVNLGLPAGFHFNERTSDLEFRPTLANETAVLCFEAREFRKVNGKMEIVGITRQEYIVIVANMPNNKMPRIIGQSAIACTGKTASITLEAKDVDKSDSTFLNINGLPQGATVNYTRNGNTALATVSWVPKQSDIQNNPHIFTVTAKDNACPFNGVSSKSYSFIVRESPSPSDIKVTSKTTKCSSAEIKLSISSRIKNPLISITDEDSISFAGDTLSTLYFKGSGWKKFYIDVASDNYCNYAIVDSVFLSPQYSVQLNTKKDSSVCANSQIRFFSYPTNGTAPYTHIWRDRFNLNNASDTVMFTVTADTNNYYKSILVIDNDGCVGIDSVDINVYRPTYIDIVNKKVEVCPNAAFQLSASRVSGPQVKQFNWIGIDTFATVTGQTPSSTRYFVAATNIHNCIVLDYADVKTFDVGVDVGTYAPICANGSVQLTANSTAGNLPFKYTWLHNNDKTTTTTANGITADSSFIIQLEDGRGCFAYDTAFIDVIPPTQYQIPANTVTCSGVPINLQLSNIVGEAPFTFIWDNNTTSTDSSETFTLNQTKNISFTIIDKHNCNVNDNINVTVNQNPDVKLGSDKTVCQNTTHKLFAFVVGGKKPLSYQWSNSLTIDSFTTTITTPQQFNVLVTDANGCIDRDTIAFDTLPSQKPTLTPLNNPFCDDAAPISLKSSPVIGVWTGAGVSGKLFNPKTAGAGIHQLTFNFISIHNCPEKGEIYAVVKQTPQPDFTVDKTKGLPSTPFNFTNITQADTTYTSEWSMGDGTTLTVANPSHTYNKVGFYTVTLKVNNGVCPEKTITKSNIIEVDSIINNIPNAQNDILNVFPIPATTVLNVVTDKEINVISIIDLQGRTIEEKQAVGKESRISVEHIPQGVYILTIELKSGAKHINKILIDH